MLDEMKVRAMTIDQALKRLGMMSAHMESMRPRFLISRYCGTNPPPMNIVTANSPVKKFLAGNSFLESGNAPSIVTKMLKMVPVTV